MARRSKAFTLIELLVVIAIISLLMSILMPAIQRVRDRAKSIVCQSGLRQWGLVMNFYTDDNDGYFMAGDGRYFEWMEPARPYYQAEEMRYCPMATRDEYPNDDNWGNTFAVWDWEEFTGSYGINEFLYNPPAGTTQQWGHDTSMNWRTRNVQGASYVPVFADCLWVGGAPHYTDEPPEFEGEWHASYVHNMKRFCLDRHSSAINVVMLDWSVRRLGLKSLWRLRWNRDFNINAALPVWPNWMESMPDPEL